MKNEIKRISDISSSSSNISFSQSNNPIMINLIELGYDYKLSKKLVSYLKPHNIEEAIEYLSEENGIIQHIFINNSNEKNKWQYVEKIEKIIYIIIILI